MTSMRLSRLLVGFALLATAPTVSLKAAAPQSMQIVGGTANEAGGNIPIVLKRVGPMRDAPATVVLSTIAGTAKPGVDYVGIANLSVTLQRGELVKTIFDPLMNDAIDRGTRSFTGKIAATGSTRLYAGSATFSIVDDDVAAPVPVPAPTPTPVPQPTTIMPIASNFDVNTRLRPAWETGGIPAVVTDDPVGAFRFVCYAGQLSYDDPILYPGQPGKAHLHQFYGNLTTNANSTYASLRAAGGSSCEQGNGPSPVAINRSAYWVPAMLAGDGNVKQPNFVALYYKREPLDNPACITKFKCVGIPTGLRFVAGYSMAKRADTYGPGAGGPVSFYCDGDNHFNKTLAEAVVNCPAGAVNVSARIAAPNCWDGRLDSDDHMSHLSYFDFAKNDCDATHRSLMPLVTITSSYRIDANFRAGKWHFSSDEMVPDVAAGTTFHADYMEAWDPTLRMTWEKSCLDEHRSASGGDLCNGKQIVGAYVSGDITTPSLVPVPPMPAM